MTDNSYRERRTLYKNPDQAKICGVCSGIADYFGFEVWVVRLITISAALLGMAGFIFIAYIVLCFVLEPKPGSKSNRGCFGKERKRARETEYAPSDSKPYRSTVKEVWKKGTTPSEMLIDIEDKFSEAEHKLQRMESYVTSDKFELEREFSKMESNEGKA